MIGGVINRRSQVREELSGHSHSSENKYTALRLAGQDDRRQQPVTAVLTQSHLLVLGGRQVKGPPADKGSVCSAGLGHLETWETGEGGIKLPATLKSTP